MANEKTYATQRLKQAADKRGQNPYQEGTRYHELWNNNPYTADTFTREETFWDRLANTFGMRSGYDTALDEWLKAGTEYDAQINQIKGEDEYNSPAAQAAREKEAGINPDLVGLQGAGAAEFAQEQTTPNVNAESEESTKILAAISEIPKVLTFGLSMTNSLMNTLGVIEDFKTKKIENGNRLMGLVNNFIDNYSIEYPRSGKWDINEVANEMSNAAIVWAKQNGFNKRDIQKFASQVGQTARGGKKASIYENATNIMKKRREYGQTAGSKYTPRTDDEEKILGIVGELVTEWDSTLLHTAKAEKHEAKNKETYNANYNAQQAATAANEENQMTVGKSALITAARKAVDKAFSKLDKYAEEGNLLAIGLETGLAALQLKYIE